MTARLTLAQSLSVVFAVLLLASSGFSIWLQVQSASRREQAVTQQLSLGLAAHIAETAQLMDSGGWRSDAVRGLFDKLMAVNPSVEVYLLNNQGVIVGNAAPPGHLRSDRVDLDPVRRLLGGAALPVTGDDPRMPGQTKVFSAAPVTVDGRQAGYVYVILEGETRDALARRLADTAVMRTTLATTAVAALLALVVGLLAFRLITRPLRSLTRAVRGFDAHGDEIPLPPATGENRMMGEEIAVLRAAFTHMSGRIAEQWRELAQQDQQRRDMVATISHDLRTPLTSLHGYLETLRLKDASLSPAERLRFLDIALAQSAKVGRLAEALFDLARLESGLVELQPETFSLSDLVQDVAQKLELAMTRGGQTLDVDMPHPPPPVRADLGLVERVLTNLIGNAIRHTPAGTRITVSVRPDGAEVTVVVADDGPGIPSAIRDSLFLRAAPWTGTGGGLGLVVVRRILQLHGRDIRLETPADGLGTAFRFSLPAA
ncbi:MAG: HAMP domain-containing histidine kinase [Telmatospirillum sp.]|nr:HAMP domain-containing histidine kinase [Telmatospirillum sp.]